LFVISSRLCQPFRSTIRTYNVFIHEHRRDTADSLKNGAAHRVTVSRPSGLQAPDAPIPRHSASGATHTIVFKIVYLALGRQIFVFIRRIKLERARGLVAVSDTFSER